MASSMRTAKSTALVTLALLTSAAPAAADTFRPTKLGDEPISGECQPADCTLRDAINEANTNSGPDSVVLKPGKTYRLSEAGSGEDTDVFGDLDVLEALTVRSSGRKPATIDAQGIDRVIDTPGLVGRLTLERVVLTGGNSASAGGGALLARSGSLRMVRSRVLNSEAGNFGGGIFVGGGATATITKTTLAGNTGEGGGIAVGPASSARLIASTVSGNDGGNGGGIFVGLGGGATLTAINSTIAGNRAQASGGGIAAASSGAVVLRSVTVARNLANTAQSGGQQGGGFAQLSTGPIVVRNSIIALNRVAGTNGAGADCGFLGFSATLRSEGRNLVSDEENCGALSQPPNFLTRRPKLGRLNRNGGPTETIELKRRSKAIDHAGRQAPGRDQRGVKRDRRPDIGAFERE